ncbi:MAG TPA: hypothetical protein VMH83_10625 [Candidatus Acidoferrum sp.]|nr:hypothetical protein [Candidatus Acidoferrum sp.]
MKEKKLALLCEKQLHAILMEADDAFRGIVDAVTTSARLCDELQDHSENSGGKQGKAIGAEMNKLLIAMQFHDEFSQRLRHVMELCRLIGEQEGEREAVETDDLPLLERVVGIFSVSAEFSVLQAIFPEYRHEQKDSAIELF